MKYRILLAPQAVHDLKCLPAHERAAVRDVFEEHLRHQPTRVSRSRIKRLRGLSQPHYRLRIGDVRVFYDVTGGTVEILAVILKSQASRWLEEEGEHS
jgi:mRNA-degrading endonuclease RelE of RelBE toxin-antitoxin system